MQEAMKEISGVRIEGSFAKLLCAAIYWCEGVKNPQSGVNFMNSDPDLMRTFLELFRSSFPVKEEKFRPQLHVHAYHDIETEIDFWAKTTNISSSQFARPYIKPHTGKRFRDNYRGCLSLRYYDAALARQLLAYGKAFLKKK